MDKNLLRWFLGRTEEESNISYYIKTTLLHVCLGMAIPTYKTLCDCHGGLPSPNHNYLILHRIHCLGQKISPGPYWVIPREELAQVPNITHLFGFVKLSSPRMKLLSRNFLGTVTKAWNSLFHKIKVTTNLTAFRMRNQLTSLSQFLHRHNWEKAKIRGQRGGKKGWKHGEKESRGGKERKGRRRSNSCRAVRREN